MANHVASIIEELKILEGKLKFITDGISLTLLALQIATLKQVLVSRGVVYDNVKN